jgi:antitoxin YefM
MFRVELDIDRILFRCEPLRMLTINYTDARNQLAGLMETASRDREPITITRNGAGKVVLLAIEEYEAMETTLHLHSTRANANQIQQSLEDYAAGKIQSGELCD